MALGAIHIDPDGDPGAPTVASPSASAGIDVSDAPAVQIPVRARHLSPSSASTFRQCPQRWKFRYVDGLPDPPGEAALTSAFAHRVLEELLNVEPSARTLDRARGFVKQIWSESTSCKDFMALDLDADAVRNFKWTAWRAIEGLWEIEDPKSVDVIDTETEVSVEIGGVPFIGHIDRVEVTIDGLVVSDYKSRRAPGRSISEDFDQVLLYAAALGEIHGTLPARVRLMYLGQRIVETAVTVEAVAEVTRQLADTWEALLQRSTAGEFPPRPSPFCGSCAFVHHCPEGLAEVERQHLTEPLRGHSLQPPGRPRQDSCHPAPARRRPDDEKSRGDGERPAVSHTPPSTPTGDRSTNRATLTTAFVTVLGVLAGEWRPRPAVSPPGRLAQDIALRSGTTAGIALSAAAALLLFFGPVIMIAIIDAAG